jgi:ATP-binding cassette subfamily B protein
MNQPLRRLWSIIRYESKLLKWAALFQALQSLSYLPFYIGVSILIDQILQNDALTAEEKFLRIGIYAAANLLLWPVHSWFTVRAFAASQQVVRSSTARLRRLVVDHLQHMSIGFFTRRGSGALANQVTVDLGRIEAFLSNVVGNLVVQIAIAAGALATLFWMNATLATITLVAVPLQVLIIRRVSSRVRTLNKRVQETGEDFSAQVVEFISGMRVTRSFGNEEIAARQMGGVIERVRTSGLDASVAMRWVMMLVQMIGEYLTVIVWCVGGVFFVQGEMALGQLVAFTALLAFTRTGFTAFFTAYDVWAQARPGLEAILAILDSKELEDFRIGPGRVALQGEVQFSNVTFSHTGDVGQPALSDINIHVPPGQRVGLVGETGAGKSTMLDLLLGFYIPQKGEIRYDGRPLSEIGLLNLRRAIAIMSQDTFLWNTTIRENIRVGRPSATDAEVEAAAARAQVHGFIAGLPAGYDTRCGERGGFLSGGQRRQR